MTLRQATWVVASWGGLTLAAMAVGPPWLGAVCALLHTCGIVGAPLAVTLHRHVRSALVVVALSFSFSVALTALSSQALVWFALARPIPIVVATTVYGLALGVLAAQAAPTVAAAAPSAPTVAPPDGQEASPPPGSVAAEGGP